MEWSISPKLQGDLASWFGSVPSVPDACTGNALLTDEGCAINGIDNFDKIFFWKTPQTDCFGAGGECVPYHEWVTNYVAVIGGR
jgi:putative spermidine/putrescine transport system substrate-binding protein